VGIGWNNDDRDAEQKIQRIANDKHKLLKIFLNMQDGCSKKQLADENCRHGKRA